MPAHCTLLVHLTVALLSSSRSHLFTHSSQPTGCTHSVRLDSAPSQPVLVRRRAAAAAVRRRRRGGIDHALHPLGTARPSLRCNAIFFFSITSCHHVISSPIQGIHCAQSIQDHPSFCCSSCSSAALQTLTRANRDIAQQSRGHLQLPAFALIDLHCSDQRSWSDEKAVRKFEQSARDLIAVSFLSQAISPSRVERSVSH